MAPHAKWLDPDKEKLVNYVYGRRAELGEGGNLNKQIANGLAAHFVQPPPAEGGPKTASACKTQWQKLKRILEALRDVKESTYPGASGWPYDDELGFQVTPENADAWDSFKTAHPIFAPFANKGWPHYEKMAEMCPRIAKGTYVLNVASSQLMQQSHDDDQLTQSQSTETLDSQASSDNPSSRSTRSASTGASSQALTIPDDSDDELEESVKPGALRSSVKENVNPTPVKRSLGNCSFNDSIGTPASKKARRSAPDALIDLAASTRYVGDALKTFLGPSVEPSPERRKQAALMLKDDARLTQKEKLALHLLFSKNTAAADSYRNAEDWIRDDVADYLLLEAPSVI
jgi:hypothetical protein